MRDIKGFVGFYEINENGDVWSVLRTDINGRKVGGRFLKHTMTNSGYLAVRLCKDGCKSQIYVHVLVAIAYHNHVPCGHRLVVDHIDNNKLNNHKNNIRIVTNKVNTIKDRNLPMSGHRGVYVYKDKFQVSGVKNGKKVHLGTFSCKDEAINTIIKFKEK